MRRTMQKALRRVLAMVALLATAGAQADEPTVGAEGYPVLILFMTMTGDSHYVDRAQVATLSQPLAAAAPPLAAFGFDLTDAQGTVLASGSFEDPRIRRGALPQSGELAEAHAEVRVDPAQYILRMPFSPAARYLTISPATAPDASTTGTSAPQRIDLASVLTAG